MKSIRQMEMLNMKAPEFSLKDYTGMPHNPTDFVGSWLILYFYPKDGTPGCSLEAQDFRDHSYELDDIDAIVVGISPDDAVSHRKFCKALDLDFILLSDPDGKVSELYDVWKQKTIFGVKKFGIERTTFVIDKEGKVRKIFTNIKPIGHANEVIEFIKSQE